METDEPSRVELFQARYFLDTGDIISDDLAFSLLHTSPILRGLILRNPVVGFPSSAPNINYDALLSRPPIDIDFTRIQAPEFQLVHPDGTTEEITEEEYDSRSFAKEVQEAKTLVESQMSKPELFLRRLFRRKFPVETMVETDLSMVA
ncbi:hypothetical protein COU14_00730 [Candidatus Kaiserbacteria bacterium CG10_big_fil_rev_8_21_14_0_10_44_10]|uniref:Uncharacterized protein n=1 Tax=Candidatus Kaiserbacteria bacterium CG10_big_fil_rev_8_21_14_0_10_44_10 TaxID=1974606 RepID=A0A2H0UI80_9BACT|nr:MAG: hypothetical protein COU14_00730 [Candidatus Kaiserbacteria bacterium CG10_big_fil_rev_8_21_14_0_10_44_10]